MRGLNEIVSRNARLALKRARAAAAEKGEKLTKAEVARRMSSRMIRQSGPGREKRGESFDPRTIDRTLTELLAGRRLWRTDYLDAFASSIGSVPERLTALDYDEGKVSEATYAQWLASALGRRLPPRQARRIIRNLTLELEREGMFELVSDVAEEMLEASGRDEAIARVNRVLLRTKVWDSQEDCEVVAMVAESEEDYSS